MLDGALSSSDLLMQIFTCHLIVIGHMEISVQLESPTDRQTDILLTEIKVITDLFVIVIRDIYICGIYI